MSNKTIQNIFKAYQDYLASTPQPLKNRKAIHALTHCRTDVMGASYFSCEENHEVIQQQHSCRHRSCYLCAQKKRLEWIERQRQRLFNIPHFHVVFTLPHEYLSLWRYNEALFTQLIFTASQQTLIQLLADKNHHGVTPGILMALHTWGRQLTLHPHTHCLVTAGGIDAAGDWQSIDKYLLPIRVVKSLYRGKMQAFIQDAFDRGELCLPENMSEQDFRRLLQCAYQKEWSVRIEERYEHGKGVLLYLARYLKGGPLHPSQIYHCSADSIGFRYLDHRDKRRKDVLLTPQAFLKRFLTHIPAMGKHTVRFYGLYATSSKQRHQRCIEVLGNLETVKTPSLTLKDMVLFCRTCGGQAKLINRVWPGPSKGNSINKADIGMCANNFVQQDDAVVLANAFHQSSQSEIPP